jgi:protocatechuate 3,4-dioxygenase beta subunit
LTRFFSIHREGFRVNSKSSSRDRRASIFEELESRRLLSAVIDLRVAGGAKSAVVSSVGQVVNLESWVTITGKDASGSNDGFQIAQGSFLSTNISGGAVNGTLKMSPAAPFADLGSHAGTSRDLDADGDSDIGSNDNLAVNDFFAVRASSMTQSGGTVSGASHSYLIGRGTFTVTSLRSGSQTNLVFRPRNYFTAALWSEDGVAKTVGTGSFTGGSALVLKRTTTGVTGSIAGKVFRDANRNNALDSGDSGLSNVRLFIDKDRDGVLDSGEPTFTTSSTGDYKFSGLAAGSYRVRQYTVPSGYKVSSPSSRYFDITLTTGQNVTGRNFANQTTTGSISGKVFKDADRDNGLDSTESGLSGVKLFIDKDHDGVLDSGEPTYTTGSAGTYSFGGLAAGSYRVRQYNVLSGYKVSSPSSKYFDVTLGTGQNLTGKNFANQLITPTGGIAGRVWNDANGDGFINSGETVRANVRVWLDKDHDGVFDSNEPSKLTDSGGNYQFTGLTAGSYRVRQVGISGYRISSPSSGYYDLSIGSTIQSGKNFGDTQRILVKGNIWYDADRDGFHDSTESNLGGWRVFIDKDKDGIFDSGEASTLTDSQGNYSFKTLAAGTYRVRVVKQTGYSYSNPSSGYFDFTLGSGGTTTRNFGLKKP